MLAQKKSQSVYNSELDHFQIRNFFKHIQELKIFSRTEKDVLVSLLEYQNPNHGLCNPSSQRMADDIGITRRTVQRALQYLRRKGLGKFIQRPQDSYCVDWDGMISFIFDNLLDDINLLPISFKRKYLILQIYDIVTHKKKRREEVQIYNSTLYSLKKENKESQSSACSDSSSTNTTLIRESSSSVERETFIREIKEKNNSYNKEVPSPMPPEIDQTLPPEYERHRERIKNDPELEDLFPLDEMSLSILKIKVAKWEKESAAPPQKVLSYTEAKLRKRDRDNRERIEAQREREKYINKIPSLYPNWAETCHKLKLNLHDVEEIMKRNDWDPFEGDNRIPRHDCGVEYAFKTDDQKLQQFLSAFLEWWELPNHYRHSKEFLLKMRSFMHLADEVRAEYGQWFNAIFWAIGSSEKLYLKNVLSVKYAPSRYKKWCESGKPQLPPIKTPYYKTPVKPGAKKRKRRTEEEKLKQWKEDLSKQERGW
jgi:hypothetical protein